MGKTQDINIRAMDQMAQLNDQLMQIGYTDKERETILVRLLLCMFADDTEVIDRGSFFAFIDKCTDYGTAGMEPLNRLFRVLGGREAAPEDIEFEERRYPELAHFPAISTVIFDEQIPDRGLNAFFWLLLQNSRDIPWRKLSPAIFGAMFQEIMNQDDRKEWGAFYTSEENILRCIRPLFLDELAAERKAAAGNRRKLINFQKKLAGLTFLDPACGCGNFLILIYRELRRLELDVVKELYDTSQRVLDISLYCKVNTGQFYGLEIEPFQAQIARIGLWLVDRQMNQEAAEEFGIGSCLTPWIRPVKIHACNALNTDWNEVVLSEHLSYIVGNPPFLGARLMNSSQKQDMKNVFWGLRSVGNLDYVTAWYRKAAEYMMGTRIRASFVSTNSICQGEQASILWKEMKEGFNMTIDFAWKTFIWNNEAKNQAKVHCIIVGFSDAQVVSRGDQLKYKVLYVENQKEIQRRRVPNINAYLSAAPDIYVGSRRKPISDVPEMVFGSMANDNGHLVLSPEERSELIHTYPNARKWIRPYLGSTEFINGQERYCLWLKTEGESEEDFRLIPEIAERIKRVKNFRLSSKRDATQKLAETPERFGEIRQPKEGSYILVPRVSSVRRPYIPMGFVSSEWIASDAVLIIPGADEAVFAILTSAMHMIWVSTIAGRLKSDFRYSATVVYNNFPFPEVSEEQHESLEQCAMKILDIRSQYAGAPLSALYDPDRMPEDLKGAHRELDELVDEIYGCTGMDEEEKLVELFRRYRELTGES